VDQITSSRITFYNFQNSKINIFKEIYKRQILSGFWKGYSLSVLNTFSFFIFGRYFFKFINFTNEHFQRRGDMDFVQENNVGGGQIAPLSRGTKWGLFVGFFNLFQLMSFPMEKLRMSMMMDMTNVVELQKGWDHSISNP
jgi:hypothetical protein